MKKLVVIGGGFAGSLIAKNLEHEFDTVLIDSKDYFEFTPSILRVLVDPEHVKKIQVLHTHYLEKANVIKGKADRATKEQVIVDGKKIPYDYLVISPGSKYSYPFKEGFIRTVRANSLRNYHNRIENADTILVAGGGLVGTELIGEMLWKYPDKEIILVHSHNELIQRSNKRARKYARKYLEKKGVKIIFGEKVTKEKKGIYFTDKKREIKADIAFMCVGISPNSEFLKRDFGKSINKKGFVDVENSLQLKNYENIFVAGDVSSIKEEKTAQNAQNHADVVIKNIRKKEKNKKLLKYKPKKRVMVLSLGKNNGILTYRSFALTGFIPGMIKNFIEKTEMKKRR